MQLKEKILSFLTDNGENANYWHGTYQGSKKWYLSRMIWVNIIALAAFAVQSKYGFIVAPGEQLMVLGFVNLIMRAITGKELEK